MDFKTYISEIKELMESLSISLLKAPTNKAANQRTRTGSIKLTKLFKEYRQVSKKYHDDQPKLKGLNADKTS